MIFNQRVLTVGVEGFLKKMPEIVYRVIFALPFLVRMRRYISSLTWILPDNIFIEKN